MGRQVLSRRASRSTITQATFTSHGSVALGLAPGRRSPGSHPPDVSSATEAPRPDPCLGSFPNVPPAGRSAADSFTPRQPVVPRSGVVAGVACYTTGPWGSGSLAFALSRGAAGRPPTHLRRSPLVHPCSGPLGLSPPAKSGAPEASFRTSPSCGRDLADGNRAHEVTGDGVLPIVAEERAPGAVAALGRGRQAMLPEEALDRRPGDAVPELA